MNSNSLFTKIASYIEYFILGLILLASIVISSYRLDEPGWEEPPHSFVLTGNSLFAQSYSKFGYLTTKLCPVEDYGWDKPKGGFNYYVNHPPLLPLLLSLSFQLFGVHAWSARLIPAICSAGILVLVFLLGRKLATRRVALLASLFLVMTPMHAYYSRIPDCFVLALFFSLLTFAFYLWWVERGTRGYYLGMYLSFVLGSFSDWVGYFVAPVILLHYLVFEHRRGRNLLFVILFSLAPIALFATYLGWVYWVGGTGTLKGLLDQFLFRTVSAGPLADQPGFTVSDFFIRGLVRSTLLLTPVICFLSIAGFARLVVSLFQKSFPKRSGFILLALGFFGLAHNLVFSNFVYVHDYTMLFHVTPFFAIAAAIGVQYITERILLGKWFWTVPFGLAICYFCGLQSISTLKQLHNRVIVPELYFLGTRINQITDQKAKVVASFQPELRLARYADRPWSVTTSLSDLSRRLQADPAYSCYVMDTTWPMDKDLREHLIRNHPMETLGKYCLFDLWGIGSNVIVPEPQIEQLVSINFGDKLMFLGYNVEEVVQKKREPSRLEKHFNAHAELLPEHRTSFRITYFWQCLEEMEEDYTLVAQFEGRQDRTYRIEQSHQGVNGAYPTSFWRVGEVIREQYEVEIPLDYLPVKYALWVGVQDPNEGENLRVVGNVDHDEGNRVRFGEIEVLPAEMPSHLVGEPRPQNRVEVNINDELVFLGHDLNKSDLTAGEELKITTYWQSLGQMERDYAIMAEIRGGGYKVRQHVDLAPTRLWQEGQYYRADTVMPVNPCALEGTYFLKLKLDSGQSTTEIELATLMSTPGSDSTSLSVWQRQITVVARSSVRGSRSLYGSISKKERL